MDNGAIVAQSDRKRPVNLDKAILVYELATPRLLAQDLVMCSAALLIPVMTLLGCLNKTAHSHGSSVVSTSIFSLCYLAASSSLCEHFMLMDDLLTTITFSHPFTLSAAPLLSSDMTGKSKAAVGLI